MEALGSSLNTDRLFEQKKKKSKYYLHIDVQGLEVSWMEESTEENKRLWMHPTTASGKLACGNSC